MSSQIQQLFRVALGLAEPWLVSKIEFSEENCQLDLCLDFPAGSQCPCPQCGRAGCGVYDSTERTWRHLNFFQHKTFLHARQPRIDCPDHGVKTVEVPWARPGSGFTLLMEAFILVLVQGGMTPAQAAHDALPWHRGQANPSGQRRPARNSRHASSDENRRSNSISVRG